ncbi:UNKNOWN [Stylonychia lemnae]|uniref:Uncharacterized protein n=1 Tax=Stylonychia lemnae TaxID=5949 RepID=A0A078BAZ7_STYLE|nr:UNKNOWN [Stylonychia lemnae]|eukprot:CDW90743.1 UNKNOWN [Stylonychia lemnae]
MCKKGLILFALDSKLILELYLDTVAVHQQCIQQISEVTSFFTKRCFVFGRLKTVFIVGCKLEFGLKLVLKVYFIWNDPQKLNLGE